MKMNLGFLFLLSLFPLTARSHIPATIQNRDVAVASELECKISSEEHEVLLNLDYQAFDQTLPDGGWRKFYRCQELTRDLIDSYVQRHSASLTKSQLKVLVWHSGQISGFLNDYPAAIASMEQTFKEDEKPDADFLWNPYVQATISFLKKDKKSLVESRNKLARGSNPFNHINLRIVDSFIRCFNSSYQDAYSLTCEPKETNQDRIKSLAVKFNPKKVLPNGIRDFIEQKKLVVVGEIHGTKEVPALFGELVSSLANEKTKTLVVLEINQSSQTAISDFLKDGDEKELAKDEFFSRKYQDGRSSKAMVGLLKKLSRLKNVTVLCMDPLGTNPSMTAQERDTAMATFISNNMGQYERTFVLSGNIHSASVVGTPWEKDFRPMVYELKSMLTNFSEDKLLNILVRYEKVDSWNCQGVEADSCAARYGKKNSSDYSTAVNWNNYFLLENPVANGHNGTIFVRSTQVSLPFVK